MNILKAVDLQKIYGQGETEDRAIDGVNLEVEKGEFVAIVGTSGSGKSTMLHTIGVLDNPTSGQDIVDEQDLSHMTDEELTIFRRRNIGFVFQQYNLVPMLNVWENIILPVKLDGKKIDKGYVDEIIDTLGIRTKLKNLPSALSGGQQQRVAIARALTAKPAILLADEPTGNLNSKTSQDVLGLLKVTNKRFHQTIVMITHNEEIAQLLYTSLFVGSVSMILSKRATEIKKFMDSAHATAQNLSEEDAERLQKTIEQSEQVERYGSGIFLGAGMDERFGFSVEVRYVDENMAESFNCLPTTGRMPKKGNEVAVSSMILETLGVTPKIGEEVTLTWEVNPMLKQYKTDTFQICGFWQGDKAVLGQMVWVSEAYAKENCYPVTQEELKNGIYNGGKEYSVWYKNLWNLEKDTSVTWFGMALQNVFRNWKKGLIVMLSIALSMVVVNCIMMLVQGYDLDSYRKVFLASDFQLDQITGSLSNTNFNGITPEIKELLNECPKSDKTGYVYYSEETHRMEPTLLEIWETLADKYKEGWTDYEKQIWEDAKVANTVNVHFLGISEAVFDKLEWSGEKCSWDTFKNGDYVIVDYGDKYTEHPVSYYQAGDVFQMEYRNGRRKDYEVIGEALMPYSLDYPYSDLIYITVIVPEEEYITQTGNESAVYAAIDAEKGADKQIKAYIDGNVLKENDMINVFSVLDMEESYQRFVSRYYMIGGFLVVILAFIGIMNFFNTTATSVISRKKELALLEVVGMTKKLISKMLVAEGFLYLGGAFVIAVLLVVFGAEKMLANTLGRAFFFRMHLTIVPCILMIPILIGIAYVIPKYQFEKMNRESVVERIRKE